MLYIKVYIYALQPESKITIRSFPFVDCRLFLVCHLFYSMVEVLLPILPLNWWFVIMWTC